MKDISAIEIHDQKQQEQIDTLIQEDIEALIKWMFYIQQTRCFA